MPPARGATTALARPGMGLRIETVDDLARVAEMLYKGGCTPPNVDKPEKVAAIIMAGLEIGLTPTQALGSIMLVNGRRSIYGDGALALVRASGQLASLHEEVVGHGDDRKGICKAVRKGEQERVFTFSVAEAKQAGLIAKSAGKDGKGTGPWVTYLDRMLVMRPRGFMMRDVFPDVLRGLITFEEAQDFDTAPRVVQVDHSPLPPRAVERLAGAEVLASLPPGPNPNDAFDYKGSHEVGCNTAEAARTSSPVDPTTSPPVPPPVPVTEPQPSTPVSAPADRVPMVSTVQLGEIKRLKTLMEAGWGNITAEEKKAKWQTVCKPYGTISALEFTSDVAARFILEVGKQVDPFTHPPSSAVSAT